MQKTVQSGGKSKGYRVLRNRCICSFKKRSDTIRDLTTEEAEGTDKACQGTSSAVVKQRWTGSFKAKLLVKLFGWSVGLVLRS